jgi:uncharacterized protein YjbI with pentapeptide repeats
MALRFVLVIALVAVLIVGVMFFAYFRLPVWLTRQVQIQNQDKFLDFLASSRSSTATLLGSALTVLTALTAIGTVYATYRSYLTMQDKQLADTLAKATELLGSKELSSRLGGVYVLRRIALTSPQDREAVLEVLTGYVRDAYNSTTMVIEENTAVDVTCPPDLKAILAVLGQIHATSGKHKFDLDLSQAVLYGVNLNGSNLSGTHFQGTHFYSVDFIDADLRSADLSNCQFSRCNLQRAKLRRANLSGAVFKDTKGFAQEQLNEALGDRSTLLPSELCYPKTWPI